MRVAVIGANGFVGSAFVRHLRAIPEGSVELTEVTRENFADAVGASHDVVIHAAGNSRKFYAEERPFEEFDASVGVVLRSLRDYPAALHILISSVDVYPVLSEPSATSEDAIAPQPPSSTYGFHKWLAEQIVRHHAASWLIFRLAGMVGPGLKKNPVFDLLHGLPLRIHPDSRYQYLGTEDVASLCWQLAESGIRNEIFNICGTGTLSMREISTLIGTEPDLSCLAPDAEPRIVDINNAKLRDRFPVPATRSALASFVASLDNR